MAAPVEDEFDSWLSKTLQHISPDIDLEIFLTYIRGILETDTSDEDKKECILGLLSEISTDDLDGTCDSILCKWDDITSAEREEKQAAEAKEKEHLDAKLASIMEKQLTCVVKSKEKTAEEQAAKAAILAQYAQVSEGEESDEDDTATTAAAAAGPGAEARGPPTGGAASTGGGSIDKALDELLVKNRNADMVNKLEKEKRDQMKASHEAKKQKDREDREKQKQKSQERKDAEKKRTQKGERRR